MTLELPAEIEAFVKAEVAEGAATTESDFVAGALELYRELKARHVDLRSHIQRSLAQARDGEVSPLDMDEIIAELRDEVDEHGQPR